MPLRHPFRRTKKPAAQTARKNPLQLAVRHAIEPLESRLLLTVFHGGDTFEFVDINNVTQRMKFFGNITAEVVGAEVDPLTNRVDLVNIPGSLNNATPLFGGILTPQGANVIGVININDPLTPQGSIGGAPVSAIASDTRDGQLYGLAVVKPTQAAGGGGGGTQAPNLLELVQLNKTTAQGVTVAELGPAAVTAAGTQYDSPGGTNTTPPQVTGATAAAFNPIDHRLYFIAAGGQSNIPKLMSVDVQAGNSTAIANSLIVYPGTFNSFPASGGGGQGTVFDVSALVWDQTSPTTARLLAAINPPQQQQQGGPPPTTAISVVNLANTNANTTLLNANVNGAAITGLSIAGDNPNAPDYLLYGVVGTQGSDIGNGAGGGGGGANGAAVGPGTVIQIHLPGFSVPLPIANTIAANLDAGVVSPNLAGLFTIEGVTLNNPVVQVVTLGSQWQVVSGGAAYQVQRNPDGSLTVSGPNFVGFVTNFGILYEFAQPALLPNGVTNPIEASPGDLTYDPNFVNPLTKQLGALIGTDTASHHLFFVSPYNRAPFNTIYRIYVSQSDETGGITVGQVPTPTVNNLTNRTMSPFAGSIGTIRYSPTRTVGAPGGTGTALLGARTNLLPNTVATEDYAILSAPLGISFDVLPDQPGAILGPGLFVAPGQILGKFLFGGTVTGQVDVPGSIDEFYAGWLLTGSARNTTASPDSVAAVAPFDNFHVGGDIRELLVKGPIGTDPTFIGNDAVPLFTTPSYTTDFDMLVGGSIGEVRSGGSLVGNIHALHNAPASTPLLGVVQSEAANPAWTFDNGLLGGDGFLNDNSFNTPQYLGSIPTALNGPNSAVTLNGVLQAIAPPPANAPNDFADYYGVSMLAGQTVTVQLSNAGASIFVNGVSSTINGFAGLSVGVFDPDGVLVASDYSDVLTALVNNAPFSFTARKPGLYRLAVAHLENSTFQGTTGPNFIQGTFTYTLNVQNLGDIAIGGIASNTSIYDHFIVGTSSSLAVGGTYFLSSSFGALNGDIGTINANQDLNTFGSIDVANGNLRCVEAGSIGVGIASTTAGATTGSVISGYGVEFIVPNGAVGLVNAYGNAQSNALVINSLESTSALPAIPVGGNIQAVSGVGAFYGGLYTNAGIGTIRVAQMNIIGVVSQFFVDMDKKGNDGFIDLIDCTGDFGTFETGGPQIRTGPGGDIRYIHVGGSVFRDHFFGGTGGGEGSSYDPGQSATITDDSGAVVTFTPVDNTVNVDATGKVVTTAQLTIVSYPIESGGSAVVSVASTGSLQITSHGDSNSQAVEIGSITIQGVGAAVINTIASPPLVGGTIASPSQPPPPDSGNFGTIETPITNVTTGGPTPVPSAGATGGSLGGGTTTPGANAFPIPSEIMTVAAGAPGMQLNQAGQPLFLTVNGPAIVDIFSINVITPASLPGNATQIINNSGGEIVNVIAASIGELISTGALGIAKTHCNSDVYGLTLLPLVSTSGPFVQQHNGILVGLVPGANQATSLGVMLVQGAAIGNIAAVLSSIGQVIATPGGPGILGPIYATALAPNFPPFQGNIGPVSIGGGIATAGSGAAQAAGLFADERLGAITGNSADIRGHIVAGRSIDSIHLNNGSILDADIAVTGLDNNAAAWGEPSAFAALGAVAVRTILDNTRGVSTINRPQLDIGSISITGNGGIMGSLISFDHMGTLAIVGGYGLISSDITAGANGTIGSMRIDGYGIRNSYIDGGASVGSLVTIKTGQQLPISAYSASVRSSQLRGLQFDPFTGLQNSVLTDLDLYLATSNASPLNGAITQGGIFADSIFVGSRNLGTLSVWRIQDDTLLSPGFSENSRSGFFSFSLPGYNYGPFVLGNPNNDPGTQLPNQIDFGSQIGNLITAQTIDGLGVVTGRLRNFRPGSDVSRLDLEISGKITNITINGNLTNSSVIHAFGINGNIGTIRILGNLDGSIIARRRIGSIMVNGAVTGTFQAPNISKIIFNGLLQKGSLEINGNVGTLLNNGDFGASGQSFVVHGSMKMMRVTGNLNANTTVEGYLKTLFVGGSITSGTQVTVAGPLGLLQVGGDIQTGATVTAHPLPRLSRRRIMGQIRGNLVNA